MAHTVQRTRPSLKPGDESEDKPGDVPLSAWPSKTFLSNMAALLQPIRLLDQAVCEILPHFQSFVFLKPVLGDLLREEGAIHAPRHIMPSRNREEGSGIIVEPNRLVEAPRLGHTLAEPSHALRAVVKPPRRPEPQARIVPREWSQFPAVSRFIQGEKNDRQIALIAELIEQRAKAGPKICPQRDIRTNVGAVLFLG